MYAVLNHLVLLIALLLPESCISYTYYFSITTSDSSNLDLWYRIRDWDDEQSSWHHYGPIQSSGTHSLTMENEPENIDDSNDWYRLYLGAYGTGSSESLTITDIKFYKNWPSTSVSDGMEYGNSYTWNCNTDSGGCCIVLFNFLFDSIGGTDVRSPCENEESFENSRITSSPTNKPTVQPTTVPTNKPSTVPTDTPTRMPTREPSNKPSIYPTVVPTVLPTNDPTRYPSEKPSEVPSSHPTIYPSSIPTSIPTSDPSLVPSMNPSINPTSIPSSNPTLTPTEEVNNDNSIINTAENSDNDANSSTESNINNAETDNSDNNNNNNESSDNDDDSGDSGDSDNSGNDNNDNNSNSSDNTGDYSTTNTNNSDEIDDTIIDTTIVHTAVTTAVDNDVINTSTNDDNGGTNDDNVNANDNDNDSLVTLGMDSNSPILFAVYAAIGFAFCVICSVILCYCIVQRRKRAMSEAFNRSNLRLKSLSSGPKYIGNGNSTDFSQKWANIAVTSNSNPHGTTVTITATNIAEREGSSSATMSDSSSGHNDNANNGDNDEVIDLGRIETSPAKKMSVINNKNNKQGIVLVVPNDAELIATASNSNINSNVNSNINSSRVSPSLGASDHEAFCQMLNDAKLGSDMVMDDIINDINNNNNAVGNGGITQGADGVDGGALLQGGILPSISQATPMGANEVNDISDNIGVANDGGGELDVEIPQTLITDEGNGDDNGNGNDDNQRDSDNDVIHEMNTTQY